MRTFAPKPKVTRQTKPAESTKPGRALSGRSRDLRPVLHAQRTTGDHAVQRLPQAKAEDIEARSASDASGLAQDFSRIPVYPPARRGKRLRLKVSVAGDRHEQEADRLAEQVMRQGEPAVIVRNTMPGSAPMLSAAHDVRARGPQHGRSLPLAEGHRSGPIRNDVTAGPQDGHSLRALGAGRIGFGGSPLSQRTRREMEARLGHDFSEVRVHRGARAAEASRLLGAKAFTVGQNIVLGSHAQDFASAEGRRLLAHELVHTVQQRARTAPLLVQRTEIDTTVGCDELVDLTAEINQYVNAAIQRALAAGGPSPNMMEVASSIAVELGGEIEDPMHTRPIENWILSLGPDKRHLPAKEVTKYRGVTYEGEDVSLWGSGGGALGPTIKIGSICIGADKIGHFFQVGGGLMWTYRTQGLTEEDVEDLSEFTEIWNAGIRATGVYSPADMEANRQGMRFFEQLVANPEMTFDIAAYVGPNWNEEVNPNYYREEVARPVWANLLTARDWTGTFHGDEVRLDLRASTEGDVLGMYEYDDDGTRVQGTLEGTLHFSTGTVTSELMEATAKVVEGVRLELRWSEPGWEGRGKGSFARTDPAPGRGGRAVLTSVGERRLVGTWGFGESSSGGGELRFDR